MHKMIQEKRKMHCKYKCTACSNDKCFYDV